MTEQEKNAEGASMGEKTEACGVNVVIATQKRYRLIEVRNKIGSILSDLDILGELKGQKVLIKPNCCGLFSPAEGRTTHPTVLAALALVLKEEGAEVMVGESASFGVNTQEAFKKTGIRRVAQELNLPLVDFKASRYISIKTDGIVLKEVQIPEEILEADLVISLAKLKTNYVTKISCSLKNLIGVLPDERKLNAHRVGLSETVADVFNTIKNRVKMLAIIDGIVGSELNKPKRAGILIGSLDLVACDRICAEVMGVDADDVRYLRIAKTNSFSEPNKINIVGVSLEESRVPFNSQYPELISIEADFGIEIIDGNPCSSCVGSLYHALKKIKSEEPELLTGVKIAVGVCESNDRDVIMFGNCSSESICKLMVVGCPPVSADLLSVFEARFKSN